MHLTLDTYLAIIGIIFGFLALAMATPPFIQMFWGGPQISVHLRDRHFNHGKALQVLIANDVVSRKWLQRFRVVRQSTEILADFSISEAGRVIVPLERAKLRTDKQHGKQVTISTLFPAIFVSVNHKGETEVNLDTEDGGREPVILPRGKYLIEISIIYGHKIGEWHAEFSVGDTVDRTYWEPGSLVRKRR